MEADVVIQGEQILYTNEFDELTYNAQKIVQMTSQLDEVLKRFSYSFSSKDSATIINKNLTCFLFWFLIDALYFSKDFIYEVERINHKRKKKNSNRSPSSNYWESLDDQKFMTKMRLLILQSHKYESLEEIHKTGIEEAISLWEKQLQRTSNRNEEKINKLSEILLKQRDHFQKIISNFEILPKSGSPLFAYYNFQKQMIRVWMDQVQNKTYGLVCQICSKRDKLLKCQKCDLCVHTMCYPKLPKQYLAYDFICENCQKGLDDNTECIFCPLKGGHFLQVESPQKRITYSILKNDGLKLKIRKKKIEKQRSFIHLSCSLWHPELEYNINRGMFQKLHRVDRKKPQSPCYQCGTNIGVTIPCAHQNCRRFYHPECGKKIDLTKNKFVEIYCDRHRRPYVHQILRQNIRNNLREIKKFYEGIDHEIKRILSSSYPSDRRISIKNNQEVERSDNCLVCQLNPDENGMVPISNCWKCYNWYHKDCSNKCPICDYQPILPVANKC